MDGRYLASNSAADSPDRVPDRIGGLGPDDVDELVARTPPRASRPSS